MTHYAIVPNRRGRVDIPEAEYQKGDYVTTEDGSFQITGRPHRDERGEVRWPAKEAEVPVELTRAGGYRVRQD